LFGVIDLAGFLADGPAPLRSETALHDARVVTMHAALEVNCALLVDSLAGLRGQEAFASSEGPPTGAPEWIGNRYTDHAGVGWQEINLQALAQDSRFLSIGS
jgi:twitching motility protein PilI